MKLKWFEDKNVVDELIKEIPALRAAIEGLGNAETQTVKNYVRDYVIFYVSFLLLLVFVGCSRILQEKRVYYS